MSSKTTNLGLTKPAVDEFYDVDVQNENMDKIDAEIGGLENPSYEEADKTAMLVSGEKFTIAFGKIAKAVSTLISHISAKATSSVLGHVKLSDSTSSTSAASAGVAATPKAVKTAYDLANENSRKIGTTDISGIGDGTMTGAVDALNQSMNAKLDWDIIFSGAIASDGYKWFKFNNYTEVYVTVLDANDYYHPFIIPINQFTSEARNFSDGAVTIRGITGAIALITGKSMAVCAR